ncbi:MAG TPA: hypothetical protein DEQ30_00650 [Porphyromonadaceae bacterium]|nr:hypothetical protein [Porphyromonadaceae bacterium]
MNSLIHTVVLDDQTFYRYGMLHAFGGCSDIRVSGEAATCADLFALLDRMSVDVAIVGVNPSGSVEYAEIARRIKSDYPTVKILAVASEDTDVIIQSMIETGIDGYISKRQASSSELAQAIRCIAAGGIYKSDL